MRKADLTAASVVKVKKSTSSRARAIPVPPELRKRGAPCPRPLRSRREPDGIRGIRGTSLLRVKQANRLYAFCVQIMLLCIRLRIPCVVENPARSLMWETSFFRALPATLHRCLSHSCMYGSRKKKATALLSSIALPRMMRVCDGSHRHEPWGIREIQHRWHFSTSDAAEYEPGFCKALAADLLEACQAKGCVLSSERMSPLQIQAVAAGKQPRRSQVQIGPSEYGACVAVQVPQDFRIPAEITDGVASPLQGVPRGSRFLGVREVFEGGVVSTHRVWAEFGVYRPPDVFAREALKAKHPFDEPFLKDDANLAAIKSILQLGPEEVARRRAKVLDHYRRRMNELAGEEAVLKASMDPDVRRVMEGKNLLLFKEVMADAGVMDPNLFSDMLHGFRLTGELKASGQFPAALKPATIDLDHLKKTSRWAKFLIESSCKKASSDMEVAAEVWKETAEQVQRGWLKGPWSWTEVEERFQGCWVPSKRFGVQQNEKVRCVDDLSEFLINSTVTQTERIELEGLDHVVALARLFAGATMGSEDTCTLPWSDSQPGVGRCHSFPLHPAWKNGKARMLRGRALDLKAAYKQLARHPDDAWASVLGVLNPELGEVCYFEAVALPFGAISAVTGFNRAARALRTCLSRLLLLVVTNFFDDFCQLEIEGLCDSARSAAEEFMGLLGWRIAEGEKALPFAQTFIMLGAQLSFEEASTGHVIVRNKPGRLDGIRKLVQPFLDGGLPDARLLASLKGKLLFAASHTFGRCTQIATQLTAHDVAGENLHSVRQAVAFALTLLEEAPPRKVGPRCDVPPICIFTDGACEQEGALVSFGAVLIDPMTGVQEVLGAEVPPRVVDAWRAGGRRQVIYFAELYPILIAKRTWWHFIQRRRILFFIDNEAAKFSFVRNYSAQVNATQLLLENAQLDFHSQALCWYSRVPSKSNLADDASRLSFEAYVGFRRVAPVFCL